MLAEAVAAIANLLLAFPLKHPQLRPVPGLMQVSGVLVGEERPQTLLDVVCMDRWFSEALIEVASELQTQQWWVGQLRQR